MTLPNNKHWTHVGIGYCCKSREATKEDMERIEKMPYGYVETVNCINCRGQFQLRSTKLGLHVESLSQ